MTFHCSCISFAPLHTYGTMRFFSPHSPCAASSILICYPSPLPCSSKTRLRFVVAPYKGLTVSVLLFLFYVLWEGEHTVDYPDKARVFM